MTRSRENRLFERFRRNGDTRALAALFDRTAAELMRIAIHLTGDRHRAEDLVQTTFLVAIEDPSSYEPGHPVLPWLLGILTNRARYWRRKERLPPLSELARKTQPKDPGSLADDREFRESLDRTLNALPEPYRQVLILHLRHGLGGKEIAELQRCSDSTVRSQLRRGLDLLRKALPAGFAASSPALLGQGSALAAIRAKVLCHVGADLVPTATFTLLGGTLLMSKTATIVTTIALVTATLALALAWPFLTTPENSGAATGTRDTVTANTEPKDQADARHSEAPIDCTYLRSPLGRTNETATSPDGADLSVRVRWESDGTPAAGVVVRLRVAGYTSLRNRQVSTDATGLASFQGVAPVKVSVIGDRGGKTDLTLVAGEVTQAELTIPSGVTVVGKVSDMADRPIADARIWVSVGKWSYDGCEATRTNELGGFGLRDVSPGRLLSALAEGFAPAQVVTVRAAGDKPTEVSFKLSPAPGTLHGIVYGPDQKPVENAAVLVGYTSSMMLIGGELQGRPAREVRTDAEGRFIVDGLWGESMPFWARAAGAAVYRDRVRIREDAPTKIEVRLLSGAAVYGTVRNPDGKPAAGIRVEALQDTVEPRKGMAYQGPYWAKVTTNTNAGGEYRLDHIHPSRARIRASARDLGKDVRVLELTNRQEERWDATLGLGLKITGSIVDSDGNPLKGWKLWGDGGKGVGYLKSVTTNERGEFTLSGCEDAPYTIVVKASDTDMHAADREIENVRPGDPPLDIKIDKGMLATSYFTGTVLASDGKPVEKATMFLQWTGKDGTQQHAGSPIEPKDGRFHTKALRPGHYLVALTTQEEGFLRMGEYDVAPNQSLDVGSHRYQKPGHLELRVVSPTGELVAGVMMTGTRNGEPAYMMLRDKAGVLEKRNLPPGRYRFCTWGSNTTLAAVEVEILPGEIAKRKMVIPDGVKRSVRHPPVPREDMMIRQVWRNEQGRIVNDSWSSFAGTKKPSTFVRRFVPGRYTVEVSDLLGNKAKASYVVDESPESDQVLEVPLPRERR